MVFATTTRRECETHSNCTAQTTNVRSGWPLDSDVVERMLLLRNQGVAPASMTKLREAALVMLRPTCRMAEQANVLPAAPHWSRQAPCCSVLHHRRASSALLALGFLPWWPVCN